MPGTGPSSSNDNSVASKPISAVNQVPLPPRSEYGLGSVGAAGALDDDDNADGDDSARTQVTVNGGTIYSQVLTSPTRLRALSDGDTDNEDDASADEAGNDNDFVAIRSGRRDRSSNRLSKTRTSSQSRSPSPVASRPLVVTSYEYASVTQGPLADSEANDRDHVDVPAPSSPSQSRSSSPALRNRADSSVLPPPSSPPPESSHAGSGRRSIDAPLSPSVTIPAAAPAPVVVPAPAPGVSVVADSAPEHVFGLGIGGISQSLEQQAKVLADRRRDVEAQQQQAQQRILLERLRMEMGRAQQLCDQARRQLSSENTASAEGLFRQYQCMQPFIDFLAAQIAYLQQDSIVNGVDHSTEIGRLTAQMESQRDSMPSFVQNLLQVVATDIDGQIRALAALHDELSAPVEANVDAILARCGALGRVARAIASTDDAVRMSRALIGQIQDARIDCRCFNNVLQAYGQAKQDLEQQQQLSSQALTSALNNFLIDTEQHVVAQQGVINLALHEITQLQTAASQITDRSALQSALEPINHRLQKIEMAKHEIDKLMGEAGRLVRAFTNIVKPVIDQAQQYLTSAAAGINHVQATQQLLTAKAAHVLPDQLTRDWQDRVVNAKDMNVVDKRGFAISSWTPTVNNLAITTVNNSTVNLNSPDANSASLKVTIPGTVVNMSVDEKIAIAAKMAAVAFFADKSLLQVSTMDFAKLTFNAPASANANNVAFIAKVKVEVQAYIEDAKAKCLAVLESHVDIADLTASSAPAVPDQGRRGGVLDTSASVPSPSPSPGSVRPHVSLSPLSCPYSSGNLTSPPVAATTATASQGHGLSHVSHHHNAVSNGVSCQNQQQQQR